MSDTIEPNELRDSVREVLADHRGDSWAIPGEEGRGLDHALWAQMAQLGWLALGVPEDDGGLGLGIAHLAVLYEELGRELASVPALSTLAVAGLLGAHPDAADREGHLAAIAEGACLAALALPASHGALTQEGGKVSGSLRNVPFADVADLLAVPVRAGPDLAFALIPVVAEGVHVAARPLVDLTRSSAEVEFAAVSLAGCTVLPLSAAEWSALEDHAAIATAADAVGLAGGLFEMTLDYLKTREQFGRAIGSFQALKARMADWKAKLEAATALVRHAAAQVEAGDAGAAASGARAYAVEIAAGFAEDAVQLHGGIGFTWEHPCHLFLKRAKLNEQLYGSPTYHKERVARLAFVPHDAPARAEPAPLLQA
jgi:alkylation response protein AidB-like acyl-CoA dehydrogenase